MYSVLNTLSSKNITSCTFLLVFKIIESLQCILKRKLYWNKFYIKGDFLIDPSFQGENISFVLAFNNGDNNIHRIVLMSINSIKSSWHNFLEPMNYRDKTYKEFKWLIIGCLLDYPYLFENCKLIRIDLTKIRT